MVGIGEGATGTGVESWWGQQEKLVQKFLHCMHATHEEPDFVGSAD